MKRNKKLTITFFFHLLLLLAIGIISYFFFYTDTGYNAIHPTKESQPSLTIYPLNPNIHFVHATSTLTVESEKGNHYGIHLHTFSKTSKPARLRQDISLIYSNGVLIGRLYGWVENAADFQQKLDIHGEGATRYDVITFHHAEFHDDAGKTSQHTMSTDQIYILDSAFSSTSSFRESKTNTQKHWQRILDHAIKEQWQYQWNHLLQFFSINQAEYEAIPFTQLYVYENESFPSFTKAETQKIVGRIWESVYRHYVLGITNTPHENIDPLGSTVPLLLLAKDKSHLIIIFRTDKGKEVQLIQRIKEVQSQPSSKN